MIISTEIDEVIGVLLRLSIGCGIFSWLTAGRSNRCNRREYAITLFMTGFLIVLIEMVRPVVGDVILLIVSVIVLLFWITACIRRFHDIDLSGWYVLLFLVPVVNFITQLYLLLKKGKEFTRWS